ncbi:MULTISPECIES: hypothetical protein [unclassified Ruegeria]|uniref:hypothetical protein n=1 Tax=unclassified Ruegeria TaxID=2625375 RepID=UPI001AE70484|nr:MULTISPECIES: hypothetical protein [unclassified Ruegeria]
MIWNKRGIVWAPTKQLGGYTHGMGPSPFRIDEDTLRVFVTVLDSKGRGHIQYVDVLAEDPTRVVAQSDGPVLGPGIPGSFDDNGIMALSPVRAPCGRIFLYYAGFEICHHIRYRIMTGLAISEDNGKTFQRYSNTPILDRSDEELYFRGGPFVLLNDGKFRMWYVAGSRWIDVAGKQMPVYDLRYAESDDGMTWPSRGYVSMALTNVDEHGFGRPWVVKRGPDDYQLFYSIRRTSLGAYRLGYAESSDGLSWTRKDTEMGLDVTPGGFDGKAIMYSAVVEAQGRTWCFYNGDGFGAAGFAVAELAE